jgi:hypothetical protein
MNKTAREIIEAVIILIASLFSILSVLLNSPQEILRGFGFYKDRQINGVPDNSIFYVVIILLSLFILYLIIEKIIDICKRRWVECNEFPYNKKDKHICKMVEHCLSQKSEIGTYEKRRVSYKKDENASCLYAEQKDSRIYDDFLKEVYFCFQYCATRDLLMTLPQNPYNQLLDGDNKIAFDDAVNLIDTSKIKTREKIIILKNTDLIRSTENKTTTNSPTFIDNLINDIKAHVGGETEFEKYIKTHNEKKIKLYWHIVPSTSKDEEFIIVNNSAALLYKEKQIVAHFSKSTVIDYINEFKEIKAKKPLDTVGFFTKFIKENIEEDDYSRIISSLTNKKRFFL